MKAFIRTSGMSCAACSARIEKALNKLNGIVSVNANFSENSVYVDFDDGVTDIDTIHNAIRKAGYDVLTGNDEEIAERQRKEANALRRSLSVSVIFCIPLMCVAMGPMLIGMDMHDHALVYGLLELILLVPILIAGRRFFLRGIPSLIRGSPTMDTLVALGVIASVAYSCYSLYLIINGDNSAVHSLFFESAGMIITLISVGKFIESRSKVRANDSIKGLLNLTPPEANVITDDGVVSKPVSDIRVGDRVLIKSGETVPVDGVIIEGDSYLNESMLTGEGLPVHKENGQRVYGGTLNTSGILKVLVDRVGDDTMLSQIVRMVRDAQGTKAPVARIADRVSSVFVPAVIIIAVSTFLLWMYAGRGLEHSMISMISVLVISCPCALGLATPMAITVGTGRAAEYGILFRSAAILERSGKIDVAVFDKTGTLTMGSPVVTEVISDDPTGMLALAASVESYSEHPLGKAIVSKAEGDGLDLFPVDDPNTVPGKGMTCTYNGRSVAIGNRSLMADNGIDVPQVSGTQVFVSIDKEYIGHIAISDPVRSDSCAAVKMLGSMSIRTIMLTGDSGNSAKAVADTVGIDEVVSEALPSDKLQKIKVLQAQGHDVAMIGDGINDSPALTQADIGIAVASGTDIAINSADIMLMNDDIRTVPYAISIGKATLKNIKQNLFFAFCYNVVCIPIAAGILYLFGMPEFTEMPILAALAMSMSSVSVVSNSLRLRSFDPSKGVGKE